MNKDGVEQILYIGKAKNLKLRVSSYFNNTQKSPKTNILVSHVNNFDFIITDNESEAFVLENNLIKKHSPKYNIRLKDDKSYPYIVINKSEIFPRPLYTRRISRNKSNLIYGPFVTGSNISEVLRILVKSFGLRDCTLSEFKKRKRPCLLFEMKQCSGSCVGKISESDYEKDLDFVVAFFTGNSKLALNHLREKMIQASENEEFELAAMIRDQIKILEDFCNKGNEQNVELDKKENIDIVSYHIGEFEIDISCYLIRNGLVLGHKNFHFQKGDDEEENEELFMNFIFQYYTMTKEILPQKIVLDLNKEKQDILNTSLSNSIEEKVKIISVGNKYKSLYSLTSEHAKEHQRFRSINESSVWIGLNKLKELLNLKEAPRLLECYDVAIWQGSSPTASQIVYRDGVPDKSSYRYYSLESRDEGNNDFAMMKEVLARRLKYGDLPDVFIVDGGKGQVNSFLEVLKDFNISIPVVGIAKERSGKGQSFKDSEVTKSEERLVIPKRLNPYFLSKNKSLFKIIVSMRDEAHRFSRKLHHKKENDRIFKDVKKKYKKK